MNDPQAAAAELERCVKEFGFLGSLIANNIGGHFYDDERFWPVFKKAEDLDVPIYLHPTLPANMEYFKGNFSQPAAFGMAANGFGWHAEVGLHVLRLFASGLFDKYPKLKIIIGHMGEYLPFQLERIITSSVPWHSWKRDLRQVWNENIWITTSGMFSVDPMACVLRAVKLDRILYSVDYPFYSSTVGLEFLKELKNSGLVNEEELNAIVYGNAQKLFGLK